MAELNLCYIYILFIIYQIKNLNIYILNIDFKYLLEDLPEYYLLFIKNKKNHIYGKIINNLCVWYKFVHLKCGLYQF